MDGKAWQGKIRESGDLLTLHKKAIFGGKRGF
jgi:hypothetical protein